MSKQAAKTVYAELLTTQRGAAPTSPTVSASCRSATPGQLGKWVDEVLAAHPGEVARFGAGKPS